MIYLITGDELLLVEESIDTLLKQARATGFDERIIIDAESSDAPSLFMSHRQNRSLFSTKKIIDIRVKQKIPASFSPLIIETAEHLDPDQIIILRMPKLSKTDTQQKWYKAIEKNGQVTTLWPLKKEGFTRWIQERFQKKHLQATSEGYALMVEQTEGNLLAASQVIEKLALLHDDKNEHITYDEISQALSDQTHFDMFELCDATLNQTPIQSLKILNTLKNQGTEPAIILWALMQDLRKLAILFSTSPNARSSVYQKQGIWSTRQALFQKALKTFNQRQLHQLIYKAKNIDEQIKGINTQNIWSALEDFCMLLSAPHLILSTLS
jgi:DNA polymerase III subunit delta